MQLVIKLLADGLLLVILAGGLALFVAAVKPKAWPRVLPVILMAGLTSLLAGKLMSLVYQPSAERPFVEQGLSAGAAYINNPGFPSDHMLLATVVVAVVYFMTPYRRLSLVLAGLTLLMGVARVAALVHTPVDIAGGVVAGLIGTVWYFKHRIDSQ